jgi:hypothetical protein
MELLIAMYEERRSRKISSNHARRGRRVVEGRRRRREGSISHSKEAKRADGNGRMSHQIVCY